MADSDRLDNFDELREAVKSLRHRLDSMEDKVMMEQLEDLAIEDEISILKELVGHSDQDIKRKINLLEELDEKYSSQRFDEKLRFLYSKMKALEQDQPEGTSEELQEELDDLENRLDHLSTQVSQAKSAATSAKEGRDLDDVYDKLYLLRDKVKELQETPQSEDGGIGDDALQQVRDEVASELDEIRDTFDDRFDEINKRHGERVQTEIEQLETQIGETLEALEYGLEEHGEILEELKAAVADHDTSWKEKIEDSITRLEQLSADSTDEWRESIEEQLVELNEAVATAGDGAVPDAVIEMVEEVQKQVDENAKAIEYGLEKHEEDLEKLKAVLRDAPDEVDDETYQQLHGSVAQLESRIEKIKEEVHEEQLTETLVRDTLQGMDEWDTLQEQVDTVQSTVDERLDTLGDRLESLAEDMNTDVETDLERLADDLANVQESVVSMSSIVERNTDHRQESKEQFSHMQEALKRIEDVVDPDMTKDELLEAVEFSSDAVEKRFEEILVRMEHLRETLEAHEERIDGLAGSQNMFESEIGRLMESQKALNNRFEEEDEKVNQKVNMLLEALEEGLEEQRKRGAGIDGAEEAASREQIDVPEKQVSEQQRNVNHVEVEERPRYDESHQHMKTLAQITLNNEKRIKQVNERLDELIDRIQDLDSHTPTIIE